MKSITLKKCTVLTLLSVTGLAAFAPSALAGNKAGNGGIAVVCRAKKDDSVKKARLLDFYELESYPDFAGKVRIETSTQPVSDQVRMATEKLGFDRELQEKVRATVEQISTTWKPIQSSKRLLDTDDADAFLIDGYDSELDCVSDLENVVVYRKAEGGIWYDRGIYEALSATDRAGLLVHEAIYRITRESSQQSTSRAARRIVGYLFSDLDRPGLLKGLVGEFITHPTAFARIDYEILKKEPIKVQISLWSNDRKTEAEMNGTPVPMSKQCTRGGCLVLQVSFDELKTESLLLELVVTRVTGPWVKYEHFITLIHGGFVTHIQKFNGYSDGGVKTSTDRLWLRSFAVHQFLVNDQLVED